MRGKLLTALLIFTISSLSFGQLTFIERFDFEVGVNRTLVINQKEMFPSQNQNGNTLSQCQEFNSYTNNYSVSLGFKWHKYHTLRVRHSRNKIGSTLTGTFGDSSFCGFGFSSFTLLNAYNQIDNSTLGVVYELQLPLNHNRILIGLGIEKQWNEFIETFVIAPGIFDSNIALHYSMGCLIPFFESVHFHPKIFTTYTLENDNVYGHFGSGRYVPVQLGVELGIRLELN